MNPKIVIRSERDADASAIAEVTAAAFETLEISNQTEQFIIEALRAAGALKLSLVAELDGRVIGHIAFSPVSISDGTAELVRAGAGIGAAGVPAAGRRQSPDPGRAVKAERYGCWRVLSGGASGVLHKIRISKHARTGAGGSAAGGLLRPVFRRAYSARQRRFPRGVQGGWAIGRRRGPA